MDGFVFPRCGKTLNPKIAELGTLLGFSPCFLRHMSSAVVARIGKLLATMEQ
jgi:hypothetical protein